MHVIKVPNVQAALPAGLRYLEMYGIQRDSRAGPVVVAPGPVTTQYTRPRERVIFWPERDANPFFHFFESLWMLAGRNDIAFLTQFVARMKQFSDDGVTQHGAYGHRWMHHFELAREEIDDGISHGWMEDIDQVASIVNMLKRNPEERRCVLQMWDASVDLGRNGVDVPCLGGNTNVWSPEGDLPIKELSRRFSSGEIDRWPVYAVDPDTSVLKIQWCTNVWRNGRKRTIRLIFDDGSKLELTPDHRLYHKVRLPLAGTHHEISETPVSNLKVGDRVWATSRWLNYKGYQQIKKQLDVNTQGSNMVRIHRAYYEFLHGQLPKDVDVHNEDDDKLNNRAENLSREDHGTHSSYHQTGDRNNMRNMSPDQHKARGQKHSIALKSYWDNLSTNERQERSQIASEAALLGHRRRRERLALQDNHVIVAIEDAGEQDVYDFTVPSFSTALVGTGVVAHNCNTQAYFSINADGALNMTVSNRSNDIIWGAYGANAVHFSMLQEYMASAIGVEVGTYWQMSNNYHAYLDTLESVKSLITEPVSRRDPYSCGDVASFPLVSTPIDEWRQDLKMFLDVGPVVGLRDPFFRKVAVPMWVAHKAFKQPQHDDGYEQTSSRYDLARDALVNCRATDWQRAAVEWINRREANWRKSQHDGPNND